MTDEILLSVRYAGEPGSRFDRDFYVQHHVPMVLDAWAKYGLLSATTLFPADPKCELLAICECRFRDAAGLEAAFASPEAATIMAHIPLFSDVAPTRLRLVPYMGG